MPRGGARPNAGRKPVDYFLKLEVGATIANALDRITVERRLENQLLSGWAQHMQRTTDAADAWARNEIGAAPGPLGPKAARFVARARMAAYAEALRTAPPKQHARPLKRLYDKRLTDEIISEVAAKYRVSKPRARAYYDWWRDESRRLTAALK